MKKPCTFDFVGWLSRLHLLPQRLTRSVVAEDLLKRLYELEKAGRTGLQLTSRDLHLRPQELEDLQQELAQEGYIQPQSLTLTTSGRQRALELTRAHRLYELYLAEHSGYAPADWHKIAHDREHHLTKRERKRIAEMLGNPLFDPHGDPIPTFAGREAHHSAGLQLEELRVGTWYYVEHVEDDDEESFQQLNEAGLTRDSVLRLDHLGPAHTRITYEGESIELPTYSLPSLSLREATEADMHDGHVHEVCRLTRLPERCVAQILGLSPSCRGAMRRRLMDLGFVAGSSISIDMHSPLGNPTAYIVRGAAIALREDQARYILIQSPTHEHTTADQSL